MPKLLKQRYMASLRAKPDGGHNYTIHLSRDTVERLQDIYAHTALPDGWRVQDMAAHVLERSAANQELEIWWGVPRGEYSTGETARRINTACHD